METDWVRVIRTMAVATVGFCSLLAAQTAPPLAIVDQPLPPLNVGVEIRIPLNATGGVPPYHWVVASGDLPQGVTFTSDGLLVGRPAKPGTFAATVTVTDSGQPAHSINKELRTEVSAALLFDWLRPPQIRGNRIDGVAQVSNGAKDDFDLTVIIVAVNEVGRATALGYQRMTLKAGVTNFQIPFGSTLPAGAYVVHADAVAEIPARNAILRQRLQTPAELKIVQGP